MIETYPLLNEYYDHELISAPYLQVETRFGPLALPPNEPSPQYASGMKPLSD